MQRISVTKCQGTGNDFVVVDARRQQTKAYAPLAKFLCDRHFGIGADGLLVITDPTVASADLQMHIFNPDGSEAEMCGNGVRCVARYEAERDPKRLQLRVETAAGIIETAIVTRNREQLVRVNMGPPEFLDFPHGHHEQRLIVGTEEAVSYVVSMGNPHVTVFLETDPAGIDLAALAKAVDAWHLFPLPPNVEIARVSNAEIFIRIHERGVGETWGCGSGACAVAAAAIAYNRACSPVLVNSKGGSVEIEWAGPSEPLMLTGGAAIIFTAEVALPKELSVAVAVV